MKKTLLTNILWLTALCVSAQSTQVDISQFFLSNYGFDTNFNYKASQNNNVGEEIKTVAGWTADLSAKYTIVGTYEFGFKGVFNTATVPAKGYDGETGGGLAISTGWGNTFKFYQTVRLPAGTYTLRVPTYNGSNITAATSQVAWIPASGTPVTSSITTFKAKQWTMDEITFTLTKATSGKIQFGMKAAANGSENSAKLLIDYVQLLGENMTLDVTTKNTILKNAITTANKRYNETAHEAAQLKEAIDAAQSVYDNTEADIAAIVDAASALNAAYTAYNAANDATSYISNPSFENGFTGWTNEGFQLQTNSAFTYSAGNTYVEKWVKTGAVGSASVKQTIKNLPNGIYEMTVAAQNLTESSPTTNNAGAYIFAVDENTKTRVYTPKDYTLKFNNIAGEVEIGFVAENAKGNWISADNFRLQYIGALDAESTLTTLQKFITTGERLQASAMASDAATALTSAIDHAKTLTTESSTEDIQAGTLQLQKAIEKAQTSVAAYKSLHSLLTKAKLAQKNDMSITASTELNNAIAQGDIIYNDPANATDATMSEAITKLDAAYTHAQTAITEYKSIATQLRTATSMQASMMSTAAKTALTAAIEAGQAITTQSSDAEVQSAAAALTTANAAAKESTALYKNVQTELNTAENVYDETKNEADALKQEIDKATRLVNDGEADPAALVAEVDILKKAVLTFRLANATPGTGTAPRVTATNHYVATGATQALMRATTEGSNILEHGVCWSTERNPTVLDNRSTKTFSLNGTIYHITGMEPATVYYARPYVMNRTYTVAYGDEVKIVTHPKGTCTWSWNRNDADDAADERCRNAIKETIDYFNEWTGIMGFHLTGNYVPGAGAGSGTADCSYGGWMRISQNTANQAIGTVLHETGHGVGVGTQARWSDTNLHSWTWFGRETNDVFHFLENVYDNPEYVFVGDGMHGWGLNATYDWLVNGSANDRHLELQYIGGMCVLHGMFIDGLDPTSGGYWYTDHNGIPGYTYNFDDEKKYYLMCKDSNRGLNEGLLYQRSTTAVGWKPYLTGDVVGDDAAWYMEFDPTTGYYRFKNADSGKYLTHATSSTNITLKSTTRPTTTENFQLMPDRTDVTINIDGTSMKTHGYWFTWTPASATFKSMSANAKGSNGYGTISQTDFNYANSATAQQWIILSEDELAAYQEKAIATGIQTIAVSDQTLDGKKSVVGIYTTGGVQLKETQPGFNIIRYSDGTTKKIFVK